MSKMDRIKFDHLGVIVITGDTFTTTGQTKVQAFLKHKEVFVSILSYLSYGNVIQVEPRQANEKLYTIYVRTEMVS